jgi:hypothetical protein
MLMFYMYIIVKLKGQKELQFENVKHKKRRLYKRTEVLIKKILKMSNLIKKKILECKTFDKVLQIYIDKMWPKCKSRPEKFPTPMEKRYQHAGQY